VAAPLVIEGRGSVCSAPLVTAFLSTGALAMFVAGLPNSSFKTASPAPAKKALKKG
jgi:hypothetical protein